MDKCIMTCWQSVIDNTGNYCYKCAYRFRVFKYVEKVGSIMLDSGGFARKKITFLHCNDLLEVNDHVKFGDFTDLDAPDKDSLIVRTVNKSSISGNFEAIAYLTP